MTTIGNITLITHPDRFFNLDSSYLLVNPSTEVMQQFQEIVCEFEENLNVFVYDTVTHDLEWLLGVACQVDIVIVDIDNCTPDTKAFVSFILTHPNAFYITTDEVTPYNLISKNRIYDLGCITDPDEDYDEEEHD